MDPAHYLESPYYEHWLTGLERLVVEKGLVRAEDLEARRRAIADGTLTPPRIENPAFVEALDQGIRHGASTARGDGKPRFGAGDRVRVRRTAPTGHTRSPRYARGAVGEIERVHPKFIFPDAHAHGAGEAPQVVYGDGEPRESVFVDLWESYLEPAPAASAKRRKTARPARRKARSTPPAGARKTRRRKR
jgi:nitrile hydratase